MNRVTSVIVVNVESMLIIRGGMPESLLTTRTDSSRLPVFVRSGG